MIDEPPPLPEGNLPSAVRVAPADSPTFAIVGAGASAGGLEPLVQFLRALPIDTGMGFVVVQHLSPASDSI